MTTKELAAALDALRTRLGADVLTLAYHCDADPGDGSGWCLEVNDRSRYGALADIIAEAVAACPQLDLFGEP